VATETWNVHINADPGRPHRAPGHVQGTWALEQVMDMLAARCGIDPLEFRRMNYADRDQQSGKPYSTKGLRACYEKGAARFGWESREERREQVAGNRKRGFGLATQIWGGLGGPPGYVVVNLYHDGTCAVFSGAQDIGTATRTAVLQVVCEELDMPVEKGRIVMGDTRGTPYGYLSGGSRTTPTQTPAARMAAADAKRQMLEMAAEQMSVPVERLTLREGVVVDSEGTASKPMTEVLAALRHRGGDQPHAMIIGKGWRGPNPDDVEVRSWGVQFAEVEVDVDTGEVDVLRIVAAHEVGRLLNPLSASSQVEGGVLQGLGFALFEERVLHQGSGRMLNDDLHEYKLPTAADVPVIETIFVDLPDPRANSTGVKGLGEPPIIPTAGAVANAIRDALGVDALPETPMTPRRILAAMGLAAS
jgi:xanthine dehydrogenase YagR molybdenum-binding subunit